VEAAEDDGLALVDAVGYANSVGAWIPAIEAGRPHGVPARGERSARLDVGCWGTEIDGVGRHLPFRACVSSFTRARE
jgi:hypothetical protein